MRIVHSLGIPLLSLMLVRAACAAAAPSCSDCAAWNAEQPAVRIFGNTYFVGTRGLSAILITSPRGHVLIDAGLPESAPRVIASIRRLGFRVRDLRLILNSHAHFDHAGGIAAVQSASGATVAASPRSAAVLRAGQAQVDDPQFGSVPGFPPVAAVRELADGEALTVGPIAVTAHFTPGHTPGGTTWTWRSCEGRRCLDLVYADSLTAVSADAFRFSGSRTYPDAVADFEHSIATLEALPCDILLTPHPDASALWQRLEARATHPGALVDRDACRRYAARAREGLSERLAREAGAPAATAPHNLILFVPDGLRSQIVDETTAPALARLRAEGVDFRNSHALFPTFTTANASTLATGHAAGDTGDFSNLIYTGFRVAAANGSSTPFLESDAVLREVNAHFGGNYLNETALVALARARGYETALIGKLGPAAIFDLAGLDGSGTLIIDDATGAPGLGVPLSAEWQAAFTAARVAQTAPGRGDNGNFGTDAAPGTWVPDLAQQQYFLEVATRVVLPRFKASGKPFVLVFWSRDPDGTQHNQGDSLLSLDPGINGPTSLAAVANADMALRLLEAALDRLGLAATTNIVVAADHGFSTIRKAGSTSRAARPDRSYARVRRGDLPLGFLAIDLYEDLKPAHPRWKLIDPDDGYRELQWRAGQRPQRGNALIGEDPDHPQVIVVANGGSDLVYLPGDARAPAARAQQRLATDLVRALLGHDYVSGVFVDERRFGAQPGALPLRAIGLGSGAAVTPVPAIVVNFASVPMPGCARGPSLCAAEYADTILQQGQGMHGSFSRADTWNFMAARGPDLRRGFVDPLPVSNADIGMTLAQLLGVEVSRRGLLTGRVLTEALAATPASLPLPSVSRRTLASKPGPGGLTTVLRLQAVGESTYFDAAGFPGRTVGLDAD